MSIKKIVQIDDLIEGDTSSADVGRSKPHPNTFEAAREKLDSLDLDKSVVVRDTPHDAEAAASANMRMIGLLSGGWTEERLREAGCIEVNHDPTDLRARYDQSALGLMNSSLPRTRVSSTGEARADFHQKR